MPNTMQPLSIHPQGDIQIDLNQVRRDIKHGIRECAHRGLKETTKWLAELNYALRDHKLRNEDETACQDDGIVPDEKESYTLAISYFDCQEYDRAAYYLENCSSPKCVFLHKYSQYMSSEKKRLDNATDSGTENIESNQVLLDLLSFFRVSILFVNQYHLALIMQISIKELIMVVIGYPSGYIAFQLQSPPYTYDIFESAEFIYSSRTHVQAVEWL